MPERADITYLALLPTDVLETAAQVLLNYNNTGLGIAEHSHRSQHAADIINEAKADLASYLDIPDDYEVLFMHGGSTAFGAKENGIQKVALNLSSSTIWFNKDLSAGI
ncbi:hypothetical protein F4782DRAFT_34759 [Xylaria castorea]|nr:hypothetical protein F4782DRAFT_34759 [Xylaria castorea]